MVKDIDQFKINNQYIVTVLKKKHVLIKPEYEFDYVVGLLHFKKIFSDNFYNICQLHVRKDFNRIPLYRQLSKLHVVQFREFSFMLLEETIKQSSR